MVDSYLRVPKLSRNIFIKDITKKTNSRTLTFNTAKIFKPVIYNKT